jgi:hypothetical protein
MSEPNIAGRAAIVGLGATEFSKNSGRTELRLAMEAVLAALADAGIAPAEVDGFSVLHHRQGARVRDRAPAGRKKSPSSRSIPHGGGAACAPVLHAAMAVATGRGQDRGRLPGHERAQLVPLRHRRATALPDADLRERELRLVHAARLPHAGGLGGHVRPPLHARVRRHQPRTSAASRWPTADTPPPTPRRSSTASRSPWRTTRTAAGSRAAAPARLLPGDRRRVAIVVTSAERARDLKHRPVRSSRRRPGHPAPGQQMMTSLLPRRAPACPRWAWWRASCGRQSGLGPDRHPDRGDLRPLHPVRAAPARGVRLLRARRGQGLHRGRPPSSSAAAADQHPRRPARRGLHPRDERHRRGRAPGARHLGQPGGDVEHVLVTAGTGVPTSGLILGAPERAQTASRCSST